MGMHQSNFEMATLRSLHQGTQCVSDRCTTREGITKEQEGYGDKYEEKFSRGTMVERILHDKKKAQLRFARELLI